MSNCQCNSKPTQEIKYPVKTYGFYHIYSAADKEYFSPKRPHKDEICLIACVQDEFSWFESDYNNYFVDSWNAVYRRKIEFQENSGWRLLSETEQIIDGDEATINGRDWEKIDTKLNLTAQMLNQCIQTARNLPADTVVVGVRRKVPVVVKNPEPENKYGYALINERNVQSFGKQQENDQFLIKNGTIEKWKSIEDAMTLFSFNFPLFYYRRPIVIQDGYRLLGEDEIIISTDEGSPNGTDWHISTYLSTGFTPREFNQKSPIKCLAVRRKVETKKESPKPPKMYGFVLISSPEDKVKYSPRREGDEFLEGDGVSWHKISYYNWPKFETNDIYRRKVDVGPDYVLLSENDSFVAKDEFTIDGIDWIPAYNVVGRTVKCVNDYNISTGNEQYFFVGVRRKKPPEVTIKANLEFTNIPSLADVTLYPACPQKLK